MAMNFKTQNAHILRGLPDRRGVGSVTRAPRYYLEVKRGVYGSYDNDNAVDTSDNRPGKPSRDWQFSARFKHLTVHDRVFMHGTQGYWGS